MPRLCMTVVAAAFFAALALAAEDEPAKSRPASRPTAVRPSLAKALAELKDPPDWFADTKVDWDTRRPWKEARLEVRRLLAGNDDARARQAVKLTWMYHRKGDIGNGHEWPLYLFMGGQMAWAVREYPASLAKTAGRGPTHEYLCFASCYAHFGEWEKALAVLDRAQKDPQRPPWRTAALAKIHEHRGDVYAAMGQPDKARSEYAAAADLYPKSEQPNGRNTLPAQVDRVRAKVELLGAKSLADVKLTDGTYRSVVPGYSKDITVTVVVAAGRIADVKVISAESADRGASRTIPRRIVEANSLKVDAISGATVTTQAIVIGAYRALKQAGLE